MSIYIYIYITVIQATCNILKESEFFRSLNLRSFFLAGFTYQSIERTRLTSDQSFWRVRSFRDQSFLVGQYLLNQVNLSELENKSSLFVASLSVKPFFVHKINKRHPQNLIWIDKSLNWIQKCHIVKKDVFLRTTHQRFLVIKTQS